MMKLSDVMATQGTRVTIFAIGRGRPITRALAPRPVVTAAGTTKEEIATPTENEPDDLATS
jgi:hypothetical protein